MRRELSRFLIAAQLGLLAVAACGGSAPDERALAPDTSTAPAPMEVSADSKGLVFRYLDPATGAVATATDASAVPEAARRVVVVFDTESPPPPGWDQVADLSRGLPTQTIPRRDFSFEVSARSRLPTGEVKARGPKRVVLFSSQGCGYCKKARAFFARHHIPFTEYDIETNPKAPAKLAALGRRAGVPAAQLQGVPIIFVDGRAILGWDKARLKKLLGI